MSRDGYLPDGVESHHIPGNRPEDEHSKACPCHDDADPICVCGCPADDHGGGPWLLCRDEKRCLCEGWKHDEDPDCVCGDLGGENENG